MLELKKIVELCETRRITRKKVAEIIAEVINFCNENEFPLTRLDLYEYSHKYSNAYSGQYANYWVIDKNHLIENDFIDVDELFIVAEKKLEKTVAVELSPAWKRNFMIGYDRGCENVPIANAFQVIEVLNKFIDVLEKYYTFASKKDIEYKKVCNEVEEAISSYKKQ